MKKMLILLMALLLASLPAWAEDAPLVYVSISDGSGALVLAYAPVALTDADGDGALTLNDALIAAHAQHHPDGAAAYLAEKSQYGMSMVTLWGDESGVYGYCINDAAAMNPLDAVQSGDHIKAYVYTDLETWSDAYCCFAAPAVTAAVNETIPLTLNANGFDGNWNPIVLPVAGAVLTINGEKTGVLTDAEGKAALSFPASGVYLVSAASDSQALVPPVCLVTVK